MKPARSLALAPQPRRHERNGLSVVIERRPADGRRAEMVRLLLELLDTPDTPDKDGRP